MPVRVRFLETTASEAPGLPFAAGQEITVEASRAAEWVRSGRAVIVRLVWSHAVDVRRETRQRKGAKRGGTVGSAS